MIKSFFNKLNISYKGEISLKNYNTYRVNTTAKYLVFPNTYDELKEIIKYLKENNIKYLLLVFICFIILFCDIFSQYYYII